MAIGIRIAIRHPERTALDLLVLNENNSSRCDMKEKGSLLAIIGFAIHPIIEISLYQKSI